MFNKVYTVSAINTDKSDNSEFFLCHSLFNFETAKSIADNSVFPAFVESFPIPAYSNNDTGIIEYKNQKMIDLECNAVWDLQHK